MTAPDTTLPEPVASLKPCPFCGGEPIMLKDHKRLGFYVACQGCFGCTVTSDKAGALAAWNRRAHPAALSDERVTESCGCVFRDLNVPCRNPECKICHDLPAALSGGDSGPERDLYNDDAPMADGEIRMTAAEEVLTWLLIEKIGAPDDRSYTPNEAQSIITAALATAPDSDRNEALEAPHG